ncbi:cytochrome P450 [Melanogaster broomeanus]|nr:cytochrome P450 [Melanogaster broomeanus]
MATANWTACARNEHHVARIHCRRVPHRLPIVGNVRGINANAPWLAYSEWSKVYGDLVYTRLFNQDIIIINSEKVAKDLLEDRSSNYSDRPNIVTIALFGEGFNTVFMPYGERWRLQRRFFHQSFKADSASRFVPMQQSKAHQLLRANHSSHVSRYSSSVIVKSIYDYDPLPTNDHVLKIATALLTPEVTAILGSFPIILTIPSWFPGMGVKRKAALCREWSKVWVGVPFKHALQRMSSGVLTTFVLAMVLNPEVQEKAHAQINMVVGRDRLPTLDDRPLLTYIDAIMRETLRWNPVTPLSIPHAVVNNDIYEGYHIPKGATVLTNLWSMAHNESKYPKPFEFIPERFLNTDDALTSDDVLHIAFGHGRRICVGRHFADVTLWSAMSMVLALFKLSVPKDEDGKEVSFEPEWTSGISTCVLSRSI